MKIQYATAVEAQQAVNRLDDRRLQKDLMIPLVRNKKQVQEAAEEYQEIHSELVDQYTKRDDDGEVVWPTTVNEDGEEVEDKSGDPVFTDKEELVDELNDLLQRDVELKIEPLSLEHFPDQIEPGVVDKLSFMIEELDYSEDDE